MQLDGLVSVLREQVLGLARAGVERLEVVVVICAETHQHLDGDVLRPPRHPPRSIGIPPLKGEVVPHALHHTFGSIQQALVLGMGE